jgi:ABC-type antimicrobial peptide transport system permease subunit
MGVLLALLGIVLGLLLFLLLLLAVPLEMAFRFEGIEPLNGQVVLRWLFGLVRQRISVPGAGRRGPAAGEESRPAPLPAGKGVHVAPAARARPSD